MELMQLKYFLEVAKRQHVTKSAEALNMAQPALTHSIKKLESELGVSLFCRKGRNITLTDYGTFFLNKLVPLMNELDSLPEEVRSFANIVDTTIHLNILAASSLVTDAIAEYERIDNELRLQLNQKETEDVYDLSVYTTEEYHNENNLNTETVVFSEKIYLAVPNNSRFAEKNSIYLSEVEDDGFISLSNSSKIRQIYDKHCQKIGIIPDIIFESDSPAAIKKMIGLNMGVGFWPEFTWEKVDKRRVRLLEINDTNFKRDIVISYRRKKRENEKARALFNYLSGYFATVFGVPNNTEPRRRASEY